MNRWNWVFWWNFPYNLIFFLNEEGNSGISTGCGMVDAYFIKLHDIWPQNIQDTTMVELQGNSCEIIQPGSKIWIWSTECISDRYISMDIRIYSETNSRYNSLKRKINGTYQLPAQSVGRPQNALGKSSTTHMLVKELFNTCLKTWLLTNEEECMLTRNFLHLIINLLPLNIPWTVKREASSWSVTTISVMGSPTLKVRPSPLHTCATAPKSSHLAPCEGGRKRQSERKRRRCTAAKRGGWEGGTTYPGPMDVGDRQYSQHTCREYSCCLLPAPNPWEVPRERQSPEEEEVSQHLY